MHLTGKIEKPKKCIYFLEVTGRGFLKLFSNESNRTLQLGS